MRKNLILLLLAAMPFTSIAQYPAAFSWNAASGEDQKMQGPCHIFASVSSVETWYRLLYGSTPDISQAHLYSPCAGADFNTTTIYNALSFFRDYGVVESSFFPYQNTSACVSGSLTDCSGPMSSYFHAWITPNSIDCNFPWQNCTPNTSHPTLRYKIGDYEEVDIASYNSDDQIKRAIMNYGPITLWFVSSVHPNTNHAYSLFGWNSSGQWLLTDSWPCNPGTVATSVPLISIFQSSIFYKAYRLVNTASRPAVFKESILNGTWVYNGESTACPETAYSNAFTINGSSTIPASGTTYTINNIGLLDNPTIEWSFISSGGAVTPASYTGPSYSVAAVTSGGGTIKARIKRPNGLCETILKENINVVGNIPFTYTKIQDQCIGGGVRRIVYQVSCTSGCTINCSWNFYPSPGSSVTTSQNNCTFTMNYTSFNTSYGLLVSVTSPQHPGVTNQATAGGPVFPCGPFRVMTGTENNADPKTENPIHIFPNPAKGKLSILLPGNDTYTIKLVNAVGQTIFTTRASANITLNTSGYKRGLYFIQLISQNRRTKVITKKVLLE